MSEDPSLRRASLRRQVDLLVEIRDRMSREPADEYDRWADALIPLTDRVLRELMEAEGVGWPESHLIERMDWFDPRLARR